MNDAVAIRQGDPGTEDENTFQYHYFRLKKEADDARKIEVYQIDRMEESIRVAFESYTACSEKIGRVKALLAEMSAKSGLDKGADE